MKARLSTAQVKLQAFELELGMLLEAYRNDSAKLPSTLLAEVLGRAFSEQCLAGYGFAGYQYAEHGVRAILLAIEELTARPPLAGRAAKRVRL